MDYCDLCSEEFESDESPFCEDCELNCIDEVTEYVYQEYYFTEDDIPYWYQQLAEGQKKFE